MLALALTVLAAAPGFPVVHSVDLVTQVDKRLPKWLTGEGDRKALLATPKQLEAFFRGLGVMPGDLPGYVAETVGKQSEKAELQQFAPIKVLLAYESNAATLHFFDESGRHCEVSLLNVGTEAAQRYVVMGGPRTDDRTIDSLLERGRQAKSMLVFAEKKEGQWNTGSMPMPKPPDCLTVLKNAAKSIYVAERAYFGENDAYSSSLTKVGVDAKSLGVTSAKVSVKGQAPAQTFVIEVGLKTGLVQMNEKAEVTVVGACP